MKRAKAELRTALAAHLAEMGEAEFVELQQRIAACEARLEAQRAELRAALPFGARWSARFYGLRQT